MVRGYLLAAGLNGAMGVMMGAWAGHGLEGTLPEQAIAWIRTASSYQLWHAAALLGLAAVAVSHSTRLFTLAGWGFGAGALIFAGALYVYALSGQGWVAAIVPMGGLLMIGGWIAVILAALRLRPPNR
jgi:uncharacterized membrane protein YgdD (TMEM256/DUF423 family)